LYIFGVALMQAIPPQEKLLPTFIVTGALVVPPAATKIVVVEVVVNVKNGEVVAAAVV
jgi:hypothetical protein